MTSSRERIAIVFMTISAVMTLVLGVAVAYEVGHPHSENLSTTQASGSSPTEQTTAGETSNTTASSGTQGKAATAGRTVTTGGGGGTAGGSTSKTSNASVGVSKGVITVGGVRRLRRGS